MGNLGKVFWARKKCIWQVLNIEITCMYSGSDFIKKTQKRFTFPKEEQRFYYWKMYILFDRDYCKAIVSTFQMKVTYFIHVSEDRSFHIDLNNLVLSKNLTRKGSLHHFKILYVHITNIFLPLRFLFSLRWKKLNPQPFR